MYSYTFESSLECKDCVLGCVCAKGAKTSGGFECYVCATLKVKTESSWEGRSAMTEITLATMAASSANTLAIMIARNVLRDLRL